MIMSEYASSTNLPRTSALAMILVLVMVLMLAGGAALAERGKVDAGLRWASAIRPPRSSRRRRALVGAPPAASTWRSAIFFLVLPIVTMIVFSFQKGQFASISRARLDAAMVRQAVRRRHAPRSLAQTASSSRRWPPTGALCAGLFSPPIRFTASASGVAAPSRCCWSCRC